MSIRGTALYFRAFFSVLAFSLLMTGLWGGQAAAGTNDIYIKNGVICKDSSHNADDDFKQIEQLGNGYNKYYDYPNGYVMNYFAGMNVDCSASPVRTLLSTQSTCVEVYYDNFNGTVHNSQRYISSSRAFLNKNNVHKVDANKSMRINGREVKLLQWHRDKLTRLVTDKNYYLQVIVVKNSQEVLTLLVRSSEPIVLQNWMPVVNSVDFIPRQGTPRCNLSFSRQNRMVTPETQELFEEHFAKDASLSWGIYEYSTVNGLSNLNSLETQLGYPFHFLVWYQSLGSEFPRGLADSAYQQGKYLELTMATWDLSRADNSTVTYDLLNGKYDAYLIDYARKIKAFGHPLLFRLNNEMNGDWCAWSAYYTSTDTELFRAMWRYVYKIFEAQGVNNALWIWNPNDLSFPGFKWNSYMNYFPGSSYVDIVGMTGYNTGTYYPGECWRDFRSIYAPLYHDYSSVFDYPFIITEFGCNSVGGDKPSWINDMFWQIGGYKNIKVAIWFNGIDMDAKGQPARIYRLDQNQQVMNQFSQGLKNCLDKSTKSK